MKSKHMLCAALASCFLVACATPDPTLSEQTNELGLAKVENSALAISFVKPDVNWRKYTKLYFATVTANNEHPADYKPPRVDVKSEGLNATYDLRDKDLRKLEQAFREKVGDVFDEHQPWEIVDKADGNTLQIDVVITDIRLAAPREDSRRTSLQFGRTYTETSGSLVLIAQLKDAQSGEVLAQAIDRGQRVSQWHLNTAVFNYGDVKSIFNSWLNTFKNGLMRVSADHEKNAN
ncbi:DUF3313 family protein [Thalassotalea agarivorans]|uniref:DUF3313 domain-containing protein n=1 Tax=Thalassotalea agarivorans TaxID=349064 RepID=A0A1H9ZHL8_THASX|nr:DUF3313 family protein [Thalassotalea agarivorans]SES80816.1 Protein of unknown function [Thalassotalea agarivorans]